MIRLLIALVCVVAAVQPAFTIHGLAPGVPLSKSMTSKLEVSSPPVGIPDNPKLHYVRDKSANITLGLDSKENIFSVTGDRLERDGKEILGSSSQRADVYKSLGQPSASFTGYDNYLIQQSGGKVNLTIFYYTGYSPDKSKRMLDKVKSYWLSRLKPL